VDPRRLLYEVYDECSSGLPIAVIDRDGELKGVVDPLHVFAKLTADDEQQPASAADRAANETTAGAQAREARQ
jgi:hypothetical protein